MLEFAQRYRFARDAPGNRPELLSGRLDRVSAEVAEEVGVFFEHGDCHAGTRQELAQHHAGRPAAGDRALDAHDRQFTGLATYD
jgi:hypothetical protein